MSLPRNARGRFIAKSINEKKDIFNKMRFTNINLRIPTSFLEEINKKIMEKKWGSRTQWIIEAVEAKLHESN